MASELMFVEYMVRAFAAAEPIEAYRHEPPDPFIDYAKMAAGYGMPSEGPISDPTKLAARSARGWIR